MNSAFAPTVLVDFNLLVNAVKRHDAEVTKNDTGFLRWFVNNEELSIVTVLKT